MSLFQSVFRNSIGRLGPLTIPLVGKLNLCTSTACKSFKFSSMASQDSLQVVHDKDKCEFSIKLSDDAAQKAFLSYSWVKPSHMDMYHTEVSPVFRGKGVAKTLAKAAFDFAVDSNTKMILSCTYLQKYFKDNPKPEYKNQID